MAGCRSCGGTKLPTQLNFPFDRYDGSASNTAASKSDPILQIEHPSARLENCPAGAPRAHTPNSARRRVWFGGTLLAEVFQRFDGGVSEFAGAAVPERRLHWVPQGAANSGAAEKAWIESRPKPQHRGPVTRIGGTLVKQPGRGDVADAEKTVAPGYKCCNLCRGQARVRRRWYRGKRGRARFRFRGRLLQLRSTPSARRFPEPRGLRCSLSDGRRWRLRLSRVLCRKQPSWG